LSTISKFVNNFILDHTLRSKILLNKKFQTQGFDILLSYVTDILRDEYYQRFIFSKNWKMYSIICGENHENLKLLDCYQVNDELNEFKSLSTDEIFEGKRIKGSKGFCQSKGFEVIPKVLILNLVSFIEFQS
jgi:hypothetical protein